MSESERYDGPNYVNVTRLVEMLGVRRQVIIDYVRDGMPVRRHGSRGRSSILYLPEVLDWIINRRVAQEMERRGSPDPDGTTMEQEQLRLISARANKTELMVQQLNESLAPIEEFAQTMRGAFVRIRSEILPLAGRLAADLENMNDRAMIRRTLLEELTRVLNSAAADVESYCDVIELNAQAEREDMHVQDH